MHDFEMAMSKFVFNRMGLVSSRAKNVVDNVHTNIYNRLKSIRAKHTSDNLPTHLVFALKSLRADKSIVHVISKANKGDKIVIMDSTHYTKFVWDHLSDKNTYMYKTLERDPTTEIVEYG